MGFWAFVIIYVVVFLIWGFYVGMEYIFHPSPENARWFLAAFIWPIVVSVLLVRLLGRAVVDAFRRN